MTSQAGAVAEATNAMWFLRAAEILKALSEPLRLRIVALLRDRELCVCELVNALGMRQANVSRHLCTLRVSGLVKRRKDATRAYYSLAHPNVMDLIECVRRVINYIPGELIAP